MILAFLAIGALSLAVLIVFLHGLHKGRVQGREP